MRDAAVFSGTKVRQIGFQETDIVSLVKPITKYAKQVSSAEELRAALPEAWDAATTGRMGPVLVDVPLDIQQLEVGELAPYIPPIRQKTSQAELSAFKQKVEELFAKAERPVVLFGSGIGFAGAEEKINKWLAETGIPVVASWHGSHHLDQQMPNFIGTIGVYGVRGANYVLQNADAVLVLGSRLDTRQRPGDPKKFVPAARVHVVDIDEEELKKYAPQGYGTSLIDLSDAAEILPGLTLPNLSNQWLDYVGGMREKWLNKDTSQFAAKNNAISPYAAILKLNKLMGKDDIIAVDIGAVTCWFYQSFLRDKQTVFTNGGFAPISYGMAGAIAAALEAPDKRVICVIGDGGFQCNIQELQTVKHYGLNIVFFLMNNRGYGIVKQFQSFYLDNRLVGTDASGGYSVPDFKKVTEAYGLTHYQVNDLDDLTPAMLNAKGGAVIEIPLHPDTIIEPKLEVGRPINDQYPYVSDEDFTAANRFVAFERVRDGRKSISD
jgi:acetolactate synthase-1/2/3 large subunit